MQLRRFTADSTPAALSAVRLALGDEAIILANRRLGDHVEIIATGQMEDEETMAAMAQMSVGELEDTIAGKSVSSIQSESVSKPGSSSTEANSAGNEQRAQSDRQPMVVDRTNDMISEPVLQEDKISISELSQVIETESTGTSPLAPLGTMPGPVHGSVNQEPVAARQAEAEVAFREPVKDEQSSNQGSAVMEELKVELAHQTDLINNHFKSLEINLWGSSAPDRGVHLQQLFALGIGAELAIRLVERTQPGTPLDVALRQSFALLKSTLPIGTDKTMSVPGVTVMSGAPGSGKTTALIKLATEHVRKSGTQSIVIICADIRRIGAFEELQAYARLLGVPTVHAHDTEELESLLEAFNHKQMVLVDHTLSTSDDAIKLPECLLSPVEPDSVRQLFTLPANTQASAAEALISKHCAGRPIQCVLTHLDTNGRLGELFNAIIRHHLPIAYWSDSASVQSPLQKADASVLVASAVAMSRRITPSPDDQWLQRLIQPSHSVFSEPPLVAGQTALEAS